MKEDNKIKGHEQTPKWLRTIQLNSWEAELLISALVLYALFQVPDFLNDFALQNFDRGSRLHRLFNILERAVNILSFGYILHILVRGIWVATVGLSYVFPMGVKIDNLDFKGKFKKELQNNGSLVKMVLRLEELSSIIYGVSFIFFGTLVGFGCYLFSFLYLVEWITPAMNRNAYFAGTAGFIMLFYFLLSLMVFIDFLTNGLFRRKNWSADWFYYVAYFFRIVTLSFLYRRSLLVLISNTKGWKSYLIPIVVLGVVVGFTELNRTLRENRTKNYYLNVEEGVYNSSHYENIRGKEDDLYVTIQSDIIQNSTLKIFLKDLKPFDDLYFYEGGTIHKTKWNLLPSDSITGFFNKRLVIKIDNEPVNNLKWFKTQHPTKYEFGFTTFIDIGDVARGPHFLKMEIDTMGMRNQAKESLIDDGYSLQKIANIYFINEAK